MIVPSVLNCKNITIVFENLTVLNLICMPPFVFVDYEHSAYSELYAIHKICQYIANNWFAVSKNIFLLFINKSQPNINTKTKILLIINKKKGTYPQNQNNTKSNKESINYLHRVHNQK